MIQSTAIMNASQLVEHYSLFLVIPVYFALVSLLINVFGVKK